MRLEDPAEFITLSLGCRQYECTGPSQAQHRRGNMLESLLAAAVHAAGAADSETSAGLQQWPRRALLQSTPSPVDQLQQEAQKANKKDSQPGFSIHHLLIFAGGLRKCGISEHLRAAVPQPQRRPASVHVCIADAVSSVMCRHRSYRLSPSDVQHLASLCFLRCAALMVGLTFCIILIGCLSFRFRQWVPSDGTNRGERLSGLTADLARLTAARPTGMQHRTSSQPTSSLLQHSAMLCHSCTAAAACECLVMDPPPFSDF